MCRKLDMYVKHALKKLEMEIEIQHINDKRILANYGIRRIPVLIINEKIVSIGYVPSLFQLQNILKSL